ncbi:MAG: DUF929 family protein, partial [Actinobacteria bacterium]|nr:DUF929 family protein [Actinomycetota bacterium]
MATAGPLRVTGDHMGKASRIRQQSAREKIAAQRAAAERTRKRNIAFTTIGSIVVVAAIVLAFVIIRTNSNSGSKSSGATLTASQAAPIMNKITAVPQSTLTAVGKGTTYPHMLIPVNGTPLTSGGKPEVVYMGAEYCPFCATERWAMAVAFSRFGTFHNVSAIHS